MLDNPSESAHGLWTRLDALLRTDPDDPGCGICRIDLDAYAEGEVDDATPAARYPHVAAHLRSCPECRDDLEGLIAALSHTTD